jgi:predicted ArsR family transcriptional regulator
MSEGDWFRLLELARVLSPKPRDTFTVRDLAKKVGWEGKDVQIASDWLYKFRKWGYVDVVGTEPSGAVRPLNVYVVTQKGRDCKARANRETQLRTLLEVISKFQEVRGTKSESKAIKELFDLATEIKEGLPVLPKAD